MTVKAKQWRVCSENGCPEMVQGATRCSEHPVSTTPRPSGHAGGWTKEWATFRTDYLDRHPVCNCDDCVLIPVARRPASTDIDHQDGHSRRCAHATDERYLVAMSHAHHSRKTAKEDGGFTGTTTPRCPPLTQLARRPARTYRAGTY